MEVLNTSNPESSPSALSILKVWRDVFSDTQRTNVERHTGHCCCSVAVLVVGMLVVVVVVAVLGVVIVVVVVVLGVGTIVVVVVVVASTEAAKRPTTAMASDFICTLTCGR